MSTLTDLLRELLARVRRELFAGLPDEAWHRQKKMVQQALTFPARHLHDLGVTITEARYRAILDTILTGMMRHGQLGAVEWRARYLLTVVQNHMRHHGDHYYAEAKGTLRDVLGNLEGRTRRSRTVVAADLTVPVLAGVHHALLLTKRSTKSPAPALQPDLFGSAKAEKPTSTIAKQGKIRTDFRRPMPK